MRECIGDNRKPSEQGREKRGYSLSVEIIFVDMYKREER